MRPAGGRVLIVDDDEATRHIVETALGDDGYQVLTAEHGAAALRVVLDQPPDVILLDLKMPVMDGWTFARVYRQHVRGPHAPLVVCSVVSEPEDGASQVGAVGVLAKPFDLDELLRVVGRLARPS